MIDELGGLHTGFQVEVAQLFFTLPAIAINATNPREARKPTEF